MNQSKKLTEGAMFIGIYIVLMLAAYIPILSLFVGVLLPIPFVIYTSRNGIKPGLVVWLTTIILTTLFFTFLSLPVTLLMGIAGLAIGYAIHKQSTAYETWGYGILGFISGIFLMVAFYQVLFGVNIFQELQIVATEQMKAYMSFMETFSIDAGNGDIESVFQEQINIFMQLIPALIILSAIFMAFIVQWISYKIINRLERKELRFPPFRNLKLPTSIIWLYFVVILLSFLNLESEGMFGIGVQNALIVLEMLLVIQGFSFIFFFADYKKVSVAIPIISVVVTFLMPIILLYFVRLLGIIDIGFNLRDRLKKQ